MSDLLTSRKFWAVIIALILMVVTVYVPAFKLDGEQLASLVVIVATYVVAVAINPAGSTWADLLSSRKFWAAMIGIVILLLTSFGKVFPLPSEDLIGICVVLGGYIAGVAFGPGDPLTRWSGMLKDGKFWATVIGLLVIVLNAFHLVLPSYLTPDVLIGMAVTIAGYVVSIGVREGPQLNALSAPNQTKTA